MQVYMMAKERAATGGIGFTVRTACRAICVQPEITVDCDGCITGALAGLPPPPPQAASAPLIAAPVPSFKKVRRFIVAPPSRCMDISFPNGPKVELEQLH
jgi:hypothetical protein